MRVRARSCVRRVVGRGESYSSNLVSHDLSLVRALLGQCPEDLPMVTLQTQPGAAGALIGLLPVLHRPRLGEL